jgi:hypothetical protein
VIGWLQLLWAGAVWSRRSRRLLFAGAALQLGIVLVWAVSRTAGVPFGPGAGVAEEVGFPDALSTGLELTAALGALVLAIQPALFKRTLGVGSLVPGMAATIALALAVGTGFALTPSQLSSHHHGSGEEAAGHTHSDGTAASGDQAAADSHSHTDGTAAGELTGTTPCELSGPPASEGQVASDSEGHSHRGPAEQDPVTREERMALQVQQEAARAVAYKYPTVADAEAAGYVMSTVYVPCIGAHYTNVGLVATFDPSAPSELLYDGTTPDARIVGLSYLVFHPGGAPDGFAGPNDRWHQHNSNGGLCFGQSGVVIGAESMTVAECEAQGGEKRELTDIWMVHDWIVPGFECSWGVFAGECPELGGRIGGTAWDAPA